MPIHSPQAQPSPAPSYLANLICSLANSGPMARWPVPLPSVIPVGVPTRGYAQLQVLSLHFSLGTSSHVGAVKSLQRLQLCHASGEFVHFTPKFFWVGEQPNLECYQKGCFCGSTVVSFSMRTIINSRQDTPQACATVPKPTHREMVPGIHSAISCI